MLHFLRGGCPQHQLILCCWQRCKGAFKKRQEIEQIDPVRSCTCGTLATGLCTKHQITPNPCRAVTVTSATGYGVPVMLLQKPVCLGVQGLQRMQQILANLDVVWLQAV